MKLRKVGEVIVVEFGTIDLKDQSEFLTLIQKLREMVQQRGGIRLILNMRKVKYISSAVIGSLVILMKKVNSQDGTLTFCCMRDDVLSVFEITNLTEILEIVRTEEVALQAQAQA